MRHPLRLLALAGADAYGTAGGGPPALSLGWMAGTGSVGTVTLRGGAALGAGVLGVSPLPAAVPFGGSTLLVNLAATGASLLPVAFDAMGTFAVAVDLIAAPLAGTDTYLQGAVPGATPLTLATSSGLRLHFGP